MRKPAPATLVAVAAGGALGGTLRWWLGDVVPDGTGFPWTTFAINVTGALALGGARPKMVGYPTATS